MIQASALALAGLSPARQNKTARLLPPLSAIRAVSLVAARAVGQQAIQEGLAEVDAAGLEAELLDQVWEPVYEPYELEVHNGLS